MCRDAQGKFGLYQNGKTGELPAERRFEPQNSAPNLKSNEGFQVLEETGSPLLK